MKRKIQERIVEMIKVSKMVRNQPKTISGINVQEQIKILSEDYIIMGKIGYLANKYYYTKSFAPVT